ncbi:ADP-ribosylglycohydrolase family protein [Neptunicella sp. SCSIO 80796]|uniref:ADP-ribosylglycohydrolase family protein n=1 Tax=Neptunicella plasticusilytica TaxID=3117012 RepID=UPI003A4DF9F4
MIIRYLDPVERLEFEIIQLTEEGRNPDGLIKTFRQIQNLPESQARQQSQQLLIELMHKNKPVDNLSLAEPDELNAIQAVAPKSSVNNAILNPVNEDILYDRILGGWLGRSAGCLLGKPVERYPRPALREMLEAGGNWPLNHYWTQHGMPDHILKKYPWKRRGGLASLRENIQCMPEDDDLNYTMLNLSVYESKGEHFSSEDLGAAWLAKLPVNETFTAERVTYFNLLSGLDAPDTGLYMNPFREWIGAQIRADFWGYISPGNPDKAAEFAWRDARLSHSRNGIYGEIFFAALIAAAFYESNIRTLVLGALSYVPAESRFARAINTVLQLPIEHMHWEQVVDSIYHHFGKYHWVHTINNAALTVAALLAGNGDLETTICNVVMGGWDTDSNGATAGSVLGIINGANALPNKWVDPLNNKIRSSLGGFDNAQFTDLAARTVAALKCTADVDKRNLDQIDDF